MILRKIDFDISKWAPRDQSIIQPYTHSLIQSVLLDDSLDIEDFIYRGGFGRVEDFELLKCTGTDYTNAKLTIDEENYSAFYGSSIDQVAKAPWCRGLDPLYWALRGHGHSNKGGWNTVNAIIVYDPKFIEIVPGSDTCYFKDKTPTPKAISAIIELDLKNKCY